jgi:hypothetical protein
MRGGLPAHALPTRELKLTSCRLPGTQTSLNPCECSFTQVTHNVLPGGGGFPQRDADLLGLGDFDGQVPHTGTEEWTRGLGYATKVPFRPWYLSTGQVGFRSRCSAHCVASVFCRAVGGWSRDHLRCSWEFLRIRHRRSCRSGNALDPRPL